MKLKLGSTLIFGFGGLLALGLSYWQHSAWYMFVLTLFVIWALAYAYEEINKLSWHYKLTENYFDGQLCGLCKTCPYLGLVVVSVAWESIQFIYAVGIQLLLYMWYSFWSLFGYKPDWRTIAFDYFHGNKRYMFRRKDSGMYISSVWPIFFVGPAALTLGLLHAGTAQVVSFYHDTQFYYTVPLTYAAILVFVGFIEMWNVTGWPATKWAYGKSCPNAKFVEKVRVPAEPSQPTQPPVLGGQL
jgi:hypothetical protein